MELKETHNLWIGLVKISELKQHEYAIEDHVYNIRKSLEKTKILRKPIIADINTGLVIDGAHRTRALSSLDAKYIPAILVNYLDNKEITLNKWIRIYLMNISSRDLSYIKSIFTFNEITITNSTIKVKLYNNGLDSYMQINKFENDYKNQINKIKFSKSIDKKIRIKNALILEPPLLTKEEVVRAAENQILLPPRSTRHITDLKKVYISYPLKYLF
ncbi:MAG: ParB N-terminal domain-containing protein [Caldisphaera sp.]|nr:ParB N-terminal domain-containing protein [Caldisphaera sp.]PMP59448.1 MAG: hypothetical protein C0202_02230 [Caldisphaera sp.]PMP88953.1 MAG: hypothetical protein C0172_01380 [Caldisphaera sp.]